MRHQFCIRAVLFMSLKNGRRQQRPLNTWLLMVSSLILLIMVKLFKNFLSAITKAVSLQRLWLYTKNYRKKALSLQFIFHSAFIMAMPVLL